MTTPLVWRGFTLTDSSAEVGAPAFHFEDAELYIGLAMEHDGTWGAVLEFCGVEVEGYGPTPKVALDVIHATFAIELEAIGKRYAERIGGAG
jgi:hypothetical protein